MNEDQGQQDMDPEVSGLISEIEKLQSQNQGLARDLSTANYPMSKDSNLIAFQLETGELLKNLERFYAGDYLEETSGGIKWKKQTKKDLIPLNKYGVNLLMEIVSKYIDKNTKLSSYEEMRVYEILGDLGDEMILVFTCNYEKMGMDTYFKKTKFRLLITTTLHLIESAYRQALKGKLLEEMNQSRIVTQSDTLGRGSMGTPARKARFGFLNPRNFGA